MDNISYKLKRISTYHLRHLRAFTTKLICCPNKHEEFKTADPSISPRARLVLLGVMVKHPVSTDELTKELIDLNLEVECELLRRI